jgi:fatty acid synthase
LPGSGTLKDITRFDAAYFGVPPKHVHMMDPQLRIILELTYEALLDAGELFTKICPFHCGITEICL